MKLSIGWAAGLALALSAVGPLRAAPPSPALADDAFPFYIPWDDATPGTATDVSFLNHCPAGKFGRVVVRDGHFALADSGERVRFFATNIAGQAAFPEKADADSIAKSLAKRGINLVRLHHLDNPWAIGHGSVWDARFPDRQHLDPTMLDRLDYLASRLIANGIYVNLNLKVSKMLTAADGFPDDALTGMNEHFPLQKRVDHFDRRMIDLQKDYARQLLTHVNAYTGRRYLDEPGVAIVEVNNENSLLSLWPGMTLGSDLDKLTPFFAKELTGQWNVWLKRRYPDQAGLMAGWNAGLTPLGRSALPVGAAWTSEQQGTAACAISPGAAVADGLPDIDIRVTATDAEDWRAQVHATGVTLVNGKPYTLSFEARSDVPRTTRVSANLDQAPWSDAGLGASIETAPQWRPFVLPFVATGTVPGHVRVGLAVGDNVTPLQLRHVSLREGSPSVTLGDGESLAAGTIALPLKDAAVPHHDLIDFLVDTDTAYAHEMLTYLRGDLGLKSLACVTQVQWGGLAGYQREAQSDLIDTHGYIGHPQFAPGADWSATRWTIANQSEVRHLAETGRSVPGDLALWRVANKPFTVSEYDQPAPSDFAAECVPLVAAFAAAQDWDAVYTFCLPEFGAQQPKAGMITGFFDHLNHPAKAAFNAFAAVALRTGAIAAIGPTATLSLPASGYRQTPQIESAWALAFPKFDPLTTRAEVLPESPAATPVATTATSGPPSPLSIGHEVNGPVVRIAGPAAAGVIGFVGGATIDAGPLHLTAKARGNDFAAITVHTLDGQPIRGTARGLVTVIGRAENVGMRWNADRTSVGDGWGSGPVRVEVPDVTVTLDRDRTARVYALDEHGRRKGDVPATFVDGKLRFDIDPKQATVWYEFAE